MTNFSNLNMLFEAVDKAWETDQIQAFRATYDGSTYCPVSGQEFLPLGPAFLEEVKFPIPSAVQAITEKQFYGQLLNSELNSEEFRRTRFASPKMVNAIQRWMGGFRRHCTSDENFCEIIGIKVDDYNAWYNAEIAMEYRWITTQWLYTRIEEIMKKARDARHSTLVDAQVAAWKKRTEGE